MLLAISGVAILGLVFVAALWAGKESDAAALDHQRKLVNGRLQDQVDRVSKDMRLMAAGFSSLLSGNAVAADGGYDSSTAEAFATVAKTVFGYNGTYLVTSTGDLALEADAETARRYKWIRPLLLPMIKESDLNGPGQSETNPERIHVALMKLEGRPSIAGVAKVTGSIEANGVKVTPVQPLYLAAFRFLDGATLDALSREQGLAGARYARTADADANEVAFQIEATATNEPIGFIIWTPDLPGSRVVARLVPLLSVAGLLIGGLFFALMGRLRKSLKELGRSEDHARHLSYHDVLTGLPNRALFAERFQHCLGTLDASAGDAVVALIDLDRFKEVNDTYGHPAGDELLRSVVIRLSPLFGERDMLARMGGDEFALLLPPGSAAGRALPELWDEVVSELAKPFNLRNGDIVVRIGGSIGAVIVNDRTLARSEYLRRADVALYEAKSHGRGRCVEYHEYLDTRNVEKDNLTQDLRLLLGSASDSITQEHKGELEVFFQSVHLASEEMPLSGAEALVRWRHPHLGLLTPDMFIPIAEEAGLIDQLGEWVLRTAALRAASWPMGITLAVNVSPTQVRRRGFGDRVLSIIKEAGLSPSRLELELTEAALFDLDHGAQETLAILRAHGIRIALDDFGTGFSSLSHLIQFNIDRIKIDRSFVNLLGSQAEGAAIVSSIIGLSRTLGKTTTAEGIETQGQRDFLIAAGCTDLQGFYFSRPMAGVDFDRIIARNEDGNTRAAHTG